MKDLELLRRHVEEIDMGIAECLHERLEIVKKIADLKKEAGLPVQDQEREEFVRRYWRNKARTLSLNKDSISRILEEIMQMSRRIQSKGPDKVCR